MLYGMRILLKIVLFLPPHIHIVGMLGVMQELAFLVPLIPSHSQP